MSSTTTIDSRLSYSEYTQEEFQRLLDEHGYVYMNEIPADFDHESFMRGFGEFMPQYDGQKVWSVKSQKRFENMYHSLNTRALYPHTECYEFPEASPQYLGLWGVVRASDGGGQTTLLDGRKFIATLTDDERQQLSSRRYEYVSADGVLEMKLGRTAVHPMYEIREGREPIFRFSYNNVNHNDDPFLLDIRDRVVEFFEKSHVAVDIEPGAILIWNNHRVLHSRTAYTDERRHLRRVWLAEAA
ncbi:TauD/TfdA family dioxygenase [Streptomyces sp. NPDC048581]|uniref:TauD/TfdA family dioxygenase n=1 Tax=Streptomyces sp. NPDC048581 TaxID=3365572 RepID=UPI003721BA0A